MKTRFNKFNLLSVCVLVSLILLLSCKQEGKGMHHPIPSENPVTLTAEAQSKVVSVKNLAGIGAENPETDKVSSTIDQERIVENDWVSITTSKYQDLHIVVKENTSNESRTYNLPMSGKPGEATLHITQSGKTTN